MTALLVAVLTAAATFLLMPGRFRRRLPIPRAVGADTAAIADVADLSGFMQKIGPWILHRWFGKRRRNQWRAAAIELVSAFAAELRAGQPVRQAFIRAQRSSPVPVAAHATAVAELGGDVPRALRTEAARHELPILGSLAALWRVAEGSGAGLAQAADRLALAEAAAQQARAEVMAQLASPRATAKVLAGLPLVGVMLGSGLGASPISWLLGSPWGWCVLVAGVTLEVLGLWWIGRLTRGVEKLL